MNVKFELERYTASIDAAPCPACRCQVVLPVVSGAESTEVSCGCGDGGFVHEPWFGWVWHGWVLARSLEGGAAGVRSRCSTYDD